MSDAAKSPTSSEFGGLTVGVLALQGAFVEHVQTIERLGATAREIRLPSDLEGIDGLIIPGGESTTIGKLLVHYELLAPLRTLVDRGFPIYGTCAGAILLAKDIGGLDQPLLATMDLVVKRNAFGRQLQSFETDLKIAGLGEQPFRAIFIRAPAITSVSEGVDVLAALDDGAIVAARQGSLLVSCFHPELTEDDRFHRAFLESVAAHRAAGQIPTAMVAITPSAST
ncbi:MAG: pyridoxal 5'-phosphate synthase glutaminase subunit PdxT [Chloroflexi bacterium]|nr:pyridoxal 5'-phosphate synthase glutaminase subunit PdxT [Chloroflexota bacterium]